MIARLPSVRRLLVLLVLGTILVVPATAGASTFPDTIRLPDGWQPEGIASGRGTSLYVGSIPTGAVWKGDARTGRGDVLVPRPGGPQRHRHQGRQAQPPVRGRRPHRQGVRLRRQDRRGPGQLPARPPGAATFVNDVAVTSKAAWFTDSSAAQLYALPLGRHGRLPGQDKVRTLPLTGDFQLGTPGPNLNGIVAADGGRVLLAVQSNTGKLFRINPRTGATREVDLGMPATLANGDGMLLAGRVLFVVQNRLNQIAVVKLSRSLDRGRVVTTITDPDFDVPTTIAFQAGRLYAVNARFGTTDPQPARYDIVKVG